MADRISKEKRAWNMSRIKGKNTGIENDVRHFLWSKGFRYRKNVRKLPGKPDIVMTKYKIAIFVNGCFWHHHPGCRLAYMPKTNVDFWNEKFNRNMENDKLNETRLKQLGYNVITIWECELKKDFESEMNRIVSLLEHSKQKMGK